MAADIEIVIGAKDQATPVINNVSKSADSNSKVLSEVGNRAKLAGTSVEGLTSAMSRNASSTENASEKATQFGLASKVSVGSVGAYAEVLKSTFTVGMQVGQMFGELIFDTKRWEEELRQATVTAGDLEQRVKKVAAIRFADQKQDIELIRDPTEKVNAYKQVIGQIDAETAGLQNRIASMRKELSEAEKEEQGNILQVFGVEFDSRVTTIPKEIEKTQKEIVELSEKRLEIERQISERTLNNEALKEQNALADRSESYIETLKKELELQKALASARGQLPADAPAPRLTGEQQTFGHAEQGKAAQALEKMPLPAASPALKLTGEQQAKIEVTTQQQTFGQADRVQATQLLTSIELLKTEGQQLQQIEKENARLEQQKVQASERIAAAKQSELDKLEMERVLLERGKAAAQAFALEKKGIDAGTAEKISVEAQRHRGKTHQGTFLSAVALDAV